jgi:lysophospholipase L1-like esterase
MVDVLEMLSDLYAYFHSEKLAIPQPDGIHSTPDGYRDWASSLWQSIGGS